jgi:hypothetical protein
MKWAGHVAHEHRVLVEIPERKIPPGRPRHRWEYNMNMDLKEVILCDIDWIDLAKDRDRWWVVVNVVINFWVL